MHQTLKTMAAVGLAGLVLLGCKSRYEKQGDAHLEANRPLVALQRYDMVKEKGNGSKEFEKNYLKALILGMKVRSVDDPSADYVDHFYNSINESLLEGTYPEMEAEYSRVLADVAQRSIAMGTNRSIEKGFTYLKKAKSLAGKDPQALAQAENVSNEYIASQLESATRKYESAKAGDELDGIVADYNLTFLSLLTDPTPEMEELWSKVRMENLSTYLMYDNQAVEGLLGQLDARINKYGVLLGITKYQKGAGKVYMEVKAFNGSTNPISFQGDRFALVDKEGNRYEPATSRGFSSSKPLVEGSHESPVAGLTFNIPSEAEPSHLEFRTEGGISEKFLP